MTDPTILAVAFALALTLTLIAQGLTLIMVVSLVTAWVREFGKRFSSPSPQALSWLRLGAFLGAALMVVAQLLLLPPTQEINRLMGAEQAPGLAMEPLLVAGGLMIAAMASVHVIALKRQIEVPMVALTGRQIGTALGALVILAACLSIYTGALRSWQTMIADGREQIATLALNTYSVQVRAAGVRLAAGCYGGDADPAEVLSSIPRPGPSRRAANLTGAIETFQAATEARNKMADQPCRRGLALWEGEPDIATSAAGAQANPE